MVKITALLISGILLVNYYATGQSNMLIFEEPVALPDFVNSEGEEIKPLLSTTGDTLFFSRALYDFNTGGKFAGMDIWFSVYDHEKKQWSIPSNRLPIKWNDKGNNILIGISDNGNTVYLNNPVDPDKGILISRKVLGNWTQPDLIPIKGIPVSGFHGFYMAPDGKKLLISMRGRNSFGQEDLYVCLKDSTGWGEPIHLGASVNSSGYEISPFLSEDGNRLYFSSNGHPGFGDADIFMSERRYGSWDVWSNPVNLGSVINSEAFDGYFSIYNDMDYFFTSNRGGDLSNIYGGKVSKDKSYLTLSTLYELITSSKTITNKEYMSPIEGSKILGIDGIPFIQFERKSYDLELSEIRKLMTICQRIDDREDINLEIYSYGDLGEDEGNDRLTQWRALNVINFFISCGLDISRLHRGDLKTAEIPIEDAQTVQIKLYRLNEDNP